MCNGIYIVSVYCDWAYNMKSIVGVYCDWVYYANSCSSWIVGVYTDWVYNANCIVGTAQMLKTKPKAL